MKKSPSKPKLSVIKVTPSYLEINLKLNYSFKIEN